MHVQNKIIGHVMVLFGFLPKKSVLLSHITPLLVMRPARTTMSNDYHWLYPEAIRPQYRPSHLHIQLHSSFVKIYLTAEVSSIYILPPKVHLLMFPSLYFFQENSIMISMNLLFYKVNFRLRTFLNQTSQLPTLHKYQAKITTIMLCK